jgi:Ca2+-binding EF-hand superfamily protein
MDHTRQGFFLVDYNKDGLIDKSDLQMTFSVLGMPPLPDEDIDKMLSEVRAKTILRFICFEMSSIISCTADTLQLECL